MFRFCPQRQQVTFPSYVSLRALVTISHEGISSPSPSLLNRKLLIESKYRMIITQMNAQRSLNNTADSRPSLCFSQDNTETLAYFHSLPSGPLLSTELQHLCAPNIPPLVFSHIPRPAFNLLSQILQLLHRELVQGGEGRLDAEH